MELSPGLVRHSISPKTRFSWVYDVAAADTWNFTQRVQGCLVVYTISQGHCFASNRQITNQNVRILDRELHLLGHTSTTTIFWKYNQRSRSSTVGPLLHSLSPWPALHSIQYRNQVQICAFSKILKPKIFFIGSVSNAWDRAEWNGRYQRRDHAATHRVVALNSRGYHKGYFAHGSNNVDEANHKSNVCQTQRHQILYGQLPKGTRLNAVQRDSQWALELAI